MATWGAHIRIAEKILDLGCGFEEKEFLIGNIGPDCGEPNEDWSQFNPPKYISHWMNEAREIEPERFFDRYLKSTYEDKKRFSFYLGNYVHLLTDVKWGEVFKYKKENDENYKKLSYDKQFIWTIKEDWYDLDHLYFKKNDNSIFHRIFKYVDSFPDYLDYYPKGAVERQIKYISSFYGEYNGNPQREYTYLGEKEMDEFVEKTSEYIIETIKEMGLDII